MLTLEEQARIARVQFEAMQLNEHQLRRVLMRTWQLWLSERRNLQNMLELEGICVDCETPHAFPLEMADTCEDEAPRTRRCCLRSERAELALA